MMVPPSVLRVRVQSPERRIRLWIPLFIIWPPLFLIALLLWPLVLVAAALLWRRGLGRPLLRGGPRLYALVCGLRGLEVRVEEPSEGVLVSFR